VSVVKPEEEGGADENAREYHLLLDYKLPDVEEAAFGDAEAAAAEASNDEGVAMTGAVAATRQLKWIGAESVYLYWSVSMWTSAELRTWQAIQDTSRPRFNMEIEELNFTTLSVICMKRSRRRMS
jgi:hypothetical protein